MTHQMIQDARQIAFEEDLLETTGVNLDDTDFPERVRRAWGIAPHEPDPDAIINLAAMTTAELAAYNESRLVRPEPVSGVQRLTASQGSSAASLSVGLPKRRITQLPGGPRRAKG